MQWLPWRAYAKLARAIETLADRLLRAPVYFGFAVLSAVILPLPVPRVVAALLVVATACLIWLWVMRRIIRREREDGWIP